MGKNSHGNGKQPGMSPEDFERLCRSIEESVSQAGKAVGAGLGTAGAAVGDAISKAMDTLHDGRKGGSSGSVVDGWPNRGADAPAGSGSGADSGSNPLSQALGAIQAGVGSWMDRRQQEEELRKRQQILDQRFAPTGGTKAAGLVMAISGALLTVLLGGVLTSFAGELALAAGTSTFAATLTSTVISAAFTGGSVFLLLSGIERMRLASRAQIVCQYMGMNEIAPISTLAKHMGVSEDKARELIRKMIKLRLLPQGRLDDQGQNLIVTDSAYRLYSQTQAQREEELARQKAEAEALRRAKRDVAPGEMTPEAKAFVAESQSYMQKLHDWDVAIDDEPVSAKIVAIQQVLARLIERVQAQPSVITCLDRLNSYYLPTTIKLLAAYDDLEDQPVQGANIVASRQEIEHTLDVLRAAFEKLLDETFQDVSMDVSSEVSVLHAVLAQEGLTKNPFDLDAGSQARADEPHADGPAPSIDVEAEAKRPDQQI